jgi:hypothetical protein
MRRQASWLGGVGLLLTLFWSAPAHATELIDFGTGLAGAGGHMKYDGAGGALTGSGILLGVMTAVGTPSNSGVHITSGPAACAFPSWCAELDFTTGGLDSYENGVYSFSPGGSFVITGGIPGTGIVNEALLWGTFTSDSVLDGGQLKFNASGADNLNPTLLSYLGITPGTPFEFIGSVIGANLGNPGSYYGGAFDVTTVSSDISSINTPEPATLAMMLVGGALFGVRKRQRAQSRVSTPTV